MFTYYLDLALRSLKRSPGLTALMVLTIAFGVAASMTAWSVFRAVSGDPIPWKSAQLYVPQIDMWGPQAQASNPDSDKGPPDALDYGDAVALMRDHRAKLQSAMYQIGPAVVPADAAKHPIQTDGHAVFSEFFPMVDAPFQYGGGWTAADDEHRAQVVVIGSKLNTKVFDGGNSVGKMLNVDGRDYRVVGVLKEWNPQPRFFDVVNTGGFASDGEGMFMPFTTAIAAGISNNGNTNCNEVPEAGFEGLQRSACIWIAYMVQLDDAAAAEKYKNYLEGFARTRYPNWAPNVRLRNLPDWLDHEHVVPSDTKVSLLIALGLLIVCLVNTAGLLLAKFLRRSSEIGVRRALGAPRLAIYAQFLTEGAVIGLAGGLLGLVLTGMGVACVGLVLPRDIANLAHLDVSLLATTLVVSVLASLLAALYPTFRAAHVVPAWQLKSN
ncbi:MAG: ABC transporter permease [Xanthomonadales bacterium PRO7]|jgi:putative ABC transport system permease protein|nr:ABC transporter permease [Xanthomonadales bacterium PRO7]